MMRYWLLLLFGIFGGVADAQPPKPAKQLSEEELAKDPARREYAATVYRAHIEFRNGNVVRANVLLDACHADLRGWEWHYVYQLCHPELFQLTAEKTDGRALNYTSAAFSPDGRSILTTNGSKTASIRDVATLKVTQTFTGEHNITHASYSNDGKRIVASGRTNTCTVFDASHGKELLKLTRMQRPVGDSAFSHDGKKIVSSGHRELTVWDATTGKELTTFPSVSFDQCRPSFSPDDRRILADGFTSVGVWNAEAGTLIQRLKGGGNGTVNIARFSPDGKRIVVTGSEANVRIYDDQLAEVLQLKGHASGQSAAVFSPDSKKIVTVGYDQTMRMWDASTGAELRQWKTTGAMSDVRFNQDGSRLLTVNTAGIQIWDANAPAQTTREFAAGSWILGMAVSPDGKHLLAGNIGNFDWKAEIRELATGNLVHTLGHHDYVVHNVEYSPDGKHILTRTGTGRTKVWDTATGKLRHDFDGTGKQAIAMAAHFTRDSSRVMMLREGKVHLWDAIKGEKIREFKAKTAVRAMWSSADSKQLHALIHGGEFITWNIDTGDDVRTVAMLDVPKTIGDIWVSPDGKRVIVGQRTEDARCYSTTTGKLLYTITSMILRDDRQLVFHPDGTRFASLQFGDNTIHIYDTASGHELLAVTGHTAGISAIAFSPDGSLLLSSGDKGPLLFHAAGRTKK